MKRWILVLLAVSLSAQARLTPEQRAKLPPPATKQIDFATDIQPIIEKSCVKCHGKGRDKGGFVMETRESLLKGSDSGKVIVEGNSAESLLIELVSGLDPDSVMPAKGTKLTAAEVSLLRAWIDQGLKWDSAITFAKKPAPNLKPRKPIVKSINKPVDELLESYFRANQIKAAKPVDDRAFARRAYLDVIGLLPTPEELETFANRRDANKRAALVRELLGRNNDYAQHWLTFWNDLLRNDYRGTGYIDGGRKQITSWVFSCLATNKPFDEFVRDLINPIPQSEGFTKGIIWRGVVNASQRPELQAAQNISQVFMGVNLKCASCHDSFINDWTLADAYGLASVFSEKPLELVQCDKPLGKEAVVRFLYPELGSLDASVPKADRLKRLSEIVTSPEDGRLSRTIVNRLWARFFGVGLVEPVDEMENPAWNQDLLDWLAADLAENHYNLKRTIELILASNAYQLPAVPLPAAPDKNFVFRGPVVRRLTAEQFADALGRITGVWNGAAVAEIDFASATSASLGHWIWTSADAGHKAPAQTVYFRKSIHLPSAPTEGRVIVTCDNSFKLFVNGKPAGSGDDFLKPQLIDITSFLVDGANLLAVAATNGERSPGDKVADQSNPAGLYFFGRIKLKNDTNVVEFGSDTTWKFSTNKVSDWDTRAFDDAAWTSSAEIGAANIGPWNLGKKLGNLASNSDWVADCRAVLTYATPLTTALGRPNREIVMTTRASMATTLQGLELMNGPTLATRLKAGSERLAAEKNPDKLIDSIYVKALGRKPTAAERSIALELVGSPVASEGISDVLWTICMLPEFQLIR